MAGTGKIVALVKALAPGVDPSVIEQAVTDWLDDHPEATTTVEDGSITDEKLASALAAKIAEIDDKYEKPSGGIPSSDMASAVQTSLGKADAAYQKPGSGIPSTDLAESYIEEPASEGTNGQVLTTDGNGGRTWTTVQGGGGGGASIDDTAGHGDTTVCWSAGKTYDEISTLSEAIENIEDDIGTVEATAIPFSVDNSYINSSGEVASATGYACTDYIDISDVDAVSFAGTMGSMNTVFWYDSSKEFISANLQPAEKMIWFYNVLLLKPSTAKYLRCVSKKTTASNPPPIAPEVTVFNGKKYVEYLASSIVGDGITDDTMAVRRMVNMGTSVTFPAVEKIKLTGTVNVQMGYAKVLDGNGVTLIATDDFYALTVEGTLNSSAAPGTMDVYVLKSEGGAIVKNFKITASDSTEGGGIDASKAFNLRIENNYIYNCANGIRFSGMNRDVIISENHLFAFTENGILFDQNVNMHQCNIVNNMILFALNDIHIYDPSAIANFQITGNDIEIVNYPSTGYSVAKCISFESTSKPSIFAEIEISGNTIQGHGTSAYIVYFSGNSEEPIADMSITGNHISNSDDCAVYLKNVMNVVLTGNNYAEITHYVYELAGVCSNILMVGEIGRAINEGTVAAGGKLHAASTATLTNIKCKNTVFTDDDVNIETSSTTNVDVTEDVSGSGVSF